ncbi:MAG: TIGR03118 family protein [Verrucomicrobia bacterium]|nr:MAG: TIGR03118 family protein [Verrucomicrobiota bacterium]
MKTSMTNVSRNLRRAASLGAILLGETLALSAQNYHQTLLVSDLSNVAAHTDTNLVNAWGLAIGEEGTLVVCATESSLAGFYRPDGRRVADSIAVEEDPTGVEINRWGDAFRLMSGHVARPSRLLFVTEQGKIMGWNPRVNASEAVVAVDNSAADAVYKGVALARSRRGPRLYATNFRGGRVEVYDGSWHSLGAFTDPAVDPGFAPFNIVHLGGVLFVTFAKQQAPDFEDDQPGPGNGFVDIFDLDGHLLRRFASHGPLNSPWGVAMAPRHFGPFGGALLIGNFGDGHLNAFHPHTGAFLGPLTDAQGNAIAIDGLWALRFRHDEGDAVLYFTAGPGGETHGVIGKIEPERQHH